MNDMHKLDELGPIANEMLGGLHAGEAMKHRIRYAAMEGAAPQRKRQMKRLVPAVCCCALALACVGAATARINPQEPAPMMARIMPDGGDVVQISTIAAGDESPALGGELLADLGDGARIRAAAPQGDSLFAAGGADMPLIAVGGEVYRMLNTPKDIGGSLLGGEIGSVKTYTSEPSLASGGEMEGGLSNVAAQGAAIYKVGGLSSGTAVAAEVDGKMRLFQRVSYAGKGPGGQKLEDTFSVRGKVKSMELSGVGTLEGQKANDVMDVLLDKAQLQSADASARRQFLTVTLENGLKLQLGVSGDTLCGCGGWSCPEFFEAFEAAL